MIDVLNESSVEREVPTRRPRDWPAFAGVAFGPLFVLGVAVEPASPYQAPMHEWVDWATDAGNGQRSLISVYFWVLAAVAFVVFVGGMARRVRTIRGGESLAGAHVYGFGLMVGVLLTAGGVVMNTGPIAYLDNENGLGKIPDPTDITFFEQMESIGFLLLTVALALAFAAWVAVTSVSLRDTMPRWFTIFSYATAVMLLGTYAFQVPIVLVPIWPLVAGILLVRRPLPAQPSRKRRAPTSTLVPARRPSYRGAESLSP